MSWGACERDRLVIVRSPLKRYLQLILNTVGEEKKQHDGLRCGGAVLRANIAGRFVPVITGAVKKKNSTITGWAFPAERPRETSPRR